MAHYFHMRVDDKTIGDLMSAAELSNVKMVPGLIRDIIARFYLKCFPGMQTPRQLNSFSIKAPTS